MCRNLGYFFEGGRYPLSWIFLTKRPILLVKVEAIKVGGPRKKSKLCSKLYIFQTYFSDFET